MTLSLCMIVKNEEENLPRCLESVRGVVDEMIIVDTGSTDATVEIAESYRATVYSFPWNGSFSDARNYGLERATGDWILILDGDDELEAQSRKVLLDIIKHSDADGYFCETINYLGDAPGCDTIMSLTFRLLRNGKGYFYSEPVHEQICSNIYAKNPDARLLNANIKVYHYGYLNKNVVGKNKRERNIGLIKKQIEENPENAFINFNLANEYNAVGDNVRALDYYEKAYRNFKLEEGFSSRLFIRMMDCYIGLGRMEDALKLANEALVYYPEFTDMELMKGIIYNSTGRYTLALSHFQKCIEMGEAPTIHSVVMGAGTFKPYFFMGEIYCELQDYPRAEECFARALQHKKDYKPALNGLLRVYCKGNTARKELADAIEGLRKYKVEDFESSVFNILMEEKYFDLALEYIKKHDRRRKPSPFSRYAKGLCKLYLRKYGETYRIMEAVKASPEYLSRALCTQALCRVTEKDFEKALELLADERLSPTDGLAIVYREFVKLVQTGDVPLLSDDEKESSIYLIAIMDLVTILLKMREVELFERALGMFNSINDKTVLLRLAKLYYQEKYYGLAYKEFLHSIRDFDLMDTEGAAMLLKIKLKGY